MPKIFKATGMYTSKVFVVHLKGGEERRIKAHYDIGSLDIHHMDDLNYKCELTDSAIFNAVKVEVNKLGSPMKGF